MRNAERFPFVAAQPDFDHASLMPYLPIQLQLGTNSVAVSGLLDSGAAVNVLPYQMGIALGGQWESIVDTLNLSGNLASFEAKPLILLGQVGRFNPVKLIFAWTRAESVPLILGQTNFFTEFDACFYRSKSYFELCPR